ncbi:MAG: hypothetical protein AAFQ87_06850 [Bacteroidota bacterium]
MKRLSLLFGFALLFGSLQAQHGAYVKLNGTFFYAAAVPVAGQFMYRYEMDSWRFGGGFAAIGETSEGAVTGGVIEAAYRFGEEQHGFQPALSLIVGREYLSVKPIDEPLFERRKFVVMPMVDLFYNYRPNPREEGLDFYVGPTIWLPPIVDVVNQNDFLGDGKYDGPFARILLSAGVGYWF